LIGVNSSLYNTSKITSRVNDVVKDSVISSAVIDTIESSIIDQVKSNVIDQIWNRVYYSTFDKVSDGL
jgi:hypothetical protein